jgi:sigma-B regulation protein RsbU (phosphoserine phosphatase)
MRVLVVDDDPVFRYMIAGVLEMAGYKVETAENGSAALDMLALKSTHPVFDLIVSDMNMPIMNGMELIQRIRRSGFELPVIVLTGVNEISIAIEAIRSGANDYLLKDENIQDTIILSVEKVMDKYRLQQENVQVLVDLAAKNERLENEKILAQKVQRNILPHTLNFAGVEIDTLYQASDQIGGDFYDAWETQLSVHFILGDVSGHSISSALMMATCKGILRSFGQTVYTPIDVVKATNRMLCEMIGEAGMFISLVYVNFRRKEEEVQIISCGHNPVFLMNSGGIHVIQSTGPVLGWDPEDDWEVESHPFKPGDRLFLYTDGLIEAKNSSGEEFGEERLKSLLEKDCYSVNEIFGEAAAFCSSNFPDDIALLAIGKSAAV